MWLWPLFGGLPAFALPSCPSSTAYDFASNAWYPSDGDVGGIRAPVNLRRDGSVCTGGPQLGFAAGWIGIENSAGTSIAQIGFIHVYDPNLGVGKYCEFWAIDGGAAHLYNCGAWGDDALLHFMITKGTSYYNIQDCGSGSGYSNCTSKNATQSIYSSAFALVSAETNYGRSGCTVHIMGTSADPQVEGATGDPIQGKHDGDAWGTKSLTASGPVCSHYHQGAANAYNHAWDDRNAS